MGCKVYLRKRTVVQGTPNTFEAFDQNESIEDYPFCMEIRCMLYTLYETIDVSLFLYFFTADPGKARGCLTSNSEYLVKMEFRQPTRKT